MQVYQCVCCSVIQSCLTLCNSMGSMPGLHIPHHLPNVAQDHVRFISDTIQPSQPPMPSTSPLNLSQHQGLSQSVGCSSDDQSIGASASASVLRMTIQGWFPLELTGLISLQGTLKHHLQNNSLKASILQCSAFFMAQLSQLYMSTGMTIALTIPAFVSKVISLLFNSLSRFVIAFLPRSSRLLTSWLQSPSTVISCLL